MLVGLLLLLSNLSATGTGPAWAHDEDAVSLTFLGHVDLGHLRLHEPSGVAWGYTERGKPRVWVVNDDAATLSVLKKTRGGDDQTTFKVVETYSLSSELTELEGVTMNSSGKAWKESPGIRHKIPIWW